MSEQTARTPRRRRRPEEAEAEILEAARRLLRERPFHQLTIDELMRATTLSRKSFYVYFRDRYELLTRLFAPLRRELDAANARWTPGDPVGGGRAAMREVMAVLARDGALVRALHDAARHDAAARRAWRDFHEPAVAAFAAAIRQGIEAGEIRPVDPEETARALLGMNLFQFFDRVVDGGAEADTEAIGDALHRVWMRALYLRDP